MLIVVVCGLAMASPAFALVKIFDGFGDADRNNNGIPLEAADVDVSGAGDGMVGPYTVLSNGGSPMVYPMDTMVQEVMEVENASDVGIRWYSIGGWTSGATPDPRAAVHILSDAAGALPETNPEIGYYHAQAISPGTKFATAIDDGLALSFDSKGRGNTAAGFFNSRIALGTEVDDSVRVSFDFRVWLSAPGLNTGTNINHIPAIGEIRFGLFQDTDSQLGQTNTTASVSGGSAVWGQENGNFRGDAGTVGANGDHGWFTRLPLDDSQNTSGRQKFDAGEESRIVEETNDQSAGSDKRIMNGASDFVARPDILDPQFVNLDVNRVYNLSLTLKRFDDPATEGTLGDTILATVTVIDRATSQQWSFENYERVDNNGIPDGISSDSWDYFVMSTAGETDSDDFDWLIDNFMVEVFGSNATGLPGDFNNDGFVNAADYTVWRNHLNESDEANINNNGDGGGVGPGDYALWKQHFGSSGSGSLGTTGVPEPATLAMLLVSVLVVGSTTRRLRK
jgi:hypothetical protein